MPWRMAFASKGLEVADIGIGCLQKGHHDGIVQISKSLKPNVFQTKTSLKPNSRIPAPVRALPRGALLDHIDNAAPKLGDGNAGEGTGQGQPLRSREEI